MIYIHYTIFLKIIKSQAWMEVCKNENRSSIIFDVVLNLGDCANVLFTSLFPNYYIFSF